MINEFFGEKSLDREGKFRKRFYTLVYSGSLNSLFETSHKFHK